MSKSKENMLKRFVIVVTIFSLAVFFIFFRSGAQAASLTSISDTMTRLATSTASNHTITFTTPTGVALTETITITFDSDFNTASIVEDDVDITDDAIDLTTATDCSGAEEASVAMAADVLTITICAGDGGAIAATSAVVVEIGTNATASGTGSNTVANPGTIGSKTISIGGTMTDDGQLAVPIMDSDQVTVSATVDPTITSDLTPGAAPYTCALGTLDAAAVNGCEITNTVSTNAASGYNTTIVENGNLCSPSVAVCTNSIADVADTDIQAGTEEYGVSTSDTDATGITADYDEVACGGATENASAITGSAQIYADEVAAIAGDATTLCFAASITATTEAGGYSHITTHITTGNF